MRSSNEKMVQVEWDAEGQRVEIHVNDEGIDYLLDILIDLKKRRPPDDVQLMTPEWGGGGLTSFEDSGDRLIVNFLKIMKWG